MGTLVLLLLLAVAGWIVWKLLKDSDKNDDGKVDVKDVVVAAKEVAAEVKAEAVKVEAKVEEVAVQVVEKVKKARKPRAKKSV